jgi:carbon storage regulator
MLILTRSIGERIVIDDNIVVTVVRIRGQRAQLGLEAPPEVAIRRAETLINGEKCETQEAVLAAHAD